MEWVIVFLSSVINFASAGINLATAFKTGRKSKKDHRSGGSLKPIYVRGNYLFPLAHSILYSQLTTFILKIQGR